jgi:hypothetical protein
MKHVWLRCWLFAMIGGLGCAVGSAPDLGATSTDTPHLEPDASPGDTPPASDGGAHDAGSNDASVQPALDGSALDSSALDGSALDAALVDAGSDGGALVDAASGCGFAGTLVTFDATPLVGSTAQLAPTSTGPGVTASPLKRTGVGVVGASGGLNANGWPSAGLDLGKHFAFSIAPPAGCAVRVSKVSLAVSASNSGPQSAALATSADGYATPKPFAPSGVTVDVPLAAVGAASAPLELHLYGYGALAATGTMRITDVLTVTGSLE